MKKKILTCFIFLSAVLTCATVNANTTIEKEAAQMRSTINSKIKTCTPYTYSGDTFVAQILGMKNRKCVYRFMNLNYKADCTLTTKQIKGLQYVDIATACTTEGQLESNGQPINLDILFRQ